MSIRVDQKSGYGEQAATGQMKRATASVYVPRPTRNRLKIVAEPRISEGVSGTSKESGLSAKRAARVSSENKTNSSKRARRATYDAPRGQIERVGYPSQSAAEAPKESNAVSYPMMAKAVLAARKILSAGAFEPMQEDFSESLDSGVTICQAQGTPSIRRAALLGFQRIPFALSPESLRFASDGLEKNFRILQLKRLGHALNLAPEVVLTENTKFLLRGFSESFTIPMITSSVLEYANQEGSLLNPDDAAWISALMQGAASNDCYRHKIPRMIGKEVKNPECKEVFAISSGYNWHVTHLFFFRGYLIYCNRGYGCGGQPGIAVYRIRNRHKVTWTLLSNLIQRHIIRKDVWDQKYSLSALINTLNLEFVYHLKQKEQVVGNCTYVSTKSAVRAALALKWIVKETGDADPAADSSFWERAFSETKESYKGWNFFDKNLVIKDFVLDLLKVQELPYKMLSPAEAQKIAGLISEKVKKKLQRYREVAHYFA